MKLHQLSLTKRMNGLFITIIGGNHNARISALTLLLYKPHYTQSMMVLSQANILPVQVSHLVNKIKCSLYFLLVFIYFL